MATKTKKKSSSSSTKKTSKGKSTPTKKSAPKKTAPKKKAPEKKGPSKEEKRLEEQFPEYDRPITGRFVTVIRGEHAGTYGVILEDRDGKLSFRSNDGRKLRLTLTLSDVELAEPGRR